MIPSVLRPGIGRALALCAWALGPCGVACTDAAPDEPASPAEVETAFRELHRGIYEVYGVALERDAIWDQVDASFAGEARTQQYVEHWTARQHMERDGTSIAVSRVDYDVVTVVETSPDRAVVDASWSVGGIVTHQRHKHPRVNRYQAVYGMARLPELGWRIVSTSMRDVRRVRSPSRDGGVFDVLDAAPEEGGGYLDPLDLLDGGLGEDTGAPDSDSQPPVEDAP